jgi:hypothetical protein
MRYKVFVSLLLVVITALFSANLLAQTVDDFNRASLGGNWTADPEYVIASNTLDNSATTASWGYLAIYNAVVNPVEVSFKWANTPLCDTEGANSGGIAIYLDSPSVNANGYCVLRRYGSLDLHPVINGVMDRAPPSTQLRPHKPTRCPAVSSKWWLPQMEQGIILIFM